MRNKLITVAIAFVGMSVAFLSIGILSDWAIFHSQSESGITIVFTLMLGLYLYGTVYSTGSKRSEESKLSAVGIYGTLGLIPLALSLAALILILSQQQKIAYLLTALAIGAQIIFLLIIKISLNIVDKVASGNNYRSEHVQWRTRIGELQSIANDDPFKFKLVELAETVNYLSRGPSSPDSEISKEIDYHITNVEHALKTNDYSLFASEIDMLERKLFLRQNNAKLTKEKI